MNPEAVRVAVTGRVPAPADFGKYPSYIRFDGVWDADYTPAQLERIALVSADFSDYSQWNGKGSIIPAERAELETVIDRAHAWGKPVRFWGAPKGRRFTIPFIIWVSTTSIPTPRGVRRVLR